MYLPAYGFLEFIMKSTEAINTITVVFFKTGLHKLQSNRFLCGVYWERRWGGGKVTSEEMKLFENSNRVIFNHTVIYKRKPHCTQV